MLHVACVLALHLRCALSGPARCGSVHGVHAWMLGCRLQRSFCCLLLALALGPSFACRFSWPFIYIHLSGRLLALPHSMPCLTLPCLTSFHIASQGPQLASLSGHDAKQREAGRGKTRMLPANFTFSQISRGSF